MFPPSFAMNIHFPQAFWTLFFFFVKFSQQIHFFSSLITRKLKVIAQEIENTPSFCKRTKINLQGTVDLDNFNRKTIGWLAPHPATLLARRRWLFCRTPYFITIFRSPVGWAALKCQHSYITAAERVSEIPSSPQLIVILPESCRSLRFFP